MEIEVLHGKFDDESILSAYTELMDKIHTGASSAKSKERPVLTEGYRGELFVAFFNHEPAAGGALIINDFLSSGPKSVGLIGFYACIDNLFVSKALFHAIEEFALRKKCTTLVGPMNGDTWHTYRLADPDPVNPFFLDLNHPAYYHDQWISNGYSIIDRYFTTKGELKPVEEASPEFEKRLSDAGVEIYPVTSESFEEYLADIYELSIQSFRNNRWYSPIPKNEFMKIYQPVRQLINPNLVLVARNKEKKMVGFIFAFPDLLNESEKRIVVKTLAVHPDRKSAGLGGYLTRIVYNNAYKLGYKTVIHALMHESNNSTKILAGSMNVYRRYSLFGKSIQ